MADTEMQKAQAAGQAGAQLQEKEGQKDVSKLLSAFGGFNAIRGFMPDADNMNPARKAAKDVFLKDKRFKDKRESLKKEISRWLELLSDDSIDTATGFADACKQAEEKYTNVLKQGITDALYTTSPHFTPSLYLVVLKKASKFFRYFSRFSTMVNKKELPHKILWGSCDSRQIYGVRWKTPPLTGGEGLLTRSDRRGSYS